MDGFVYQALNERFYSSVRFVEIDSLKGHEETDQKRVEELRDRIISEGILKFAVAVDKNTNVILDGHHRLHALKGLGCSRIPVVFVDYQSPLIVVKGWNGNGDVTKEMVIEAAFSGKKLPPKTSRHLLRLNGNLEHIFTIEKMVNAQLEELE